MHFGDVLREDAPDPALEQWERIKEFPFEVVGLKPQPGVEEFGPSGFGSSYDGAGTQAAHASLTYALFRFPENRDDARNLGDLDEATQAELATRPPSLLPPWLTRQLELQHYPMLWEAVRTSWFRDTDTAPTLADVLVEHTNYVLMNQLRAERGLEGASGSLPPAPDVTVTHVQHAGTLDVNGVARAAVVIDTDPHIYAIGAHLDHSIVTVVVPRDDLPFIELAVATRA